TRDGGVGHRLGNDHGCGRQTGDQIWPPPFLRVAAQPAHDGNEAGQFVAIVHCHDHAPFLVAGGRVHRGVGDVSAVVDADVPGGFTLIVGGAANDDRGRRAGKRPVRWRGGSCTDRHSDGHPRGHGPGVAVVVVVIVIVVVVLGVVLPVL